MRKGPHTLALDVGGSEIKSLTLDPSGEAIGVHRSEKTPRPATPPRLVNKIINLAKSEEYDRLSVGFPGLVRVSDGIILTAPNLDGKWPGFHLAYALRGKLKRPVRVAKDADLHGFGAISGEGVELMLTLGTGLGSALFIDGRLVPNIDLAHHPMRAGFTYEESLGKHALDRFGEEAWQANLLCAINQLFETFNYDTLYVGGGHAALVEGLGLPPEVQIVSNIVGLLGCVALWDSDKRPSSWGPAG